MTLFEAMFPILDDKQREEGSQILADYKAMDTEAFLMRHKKFAEYPGREFYLDNAGGDLSLDTSLEYLRGIKAVETTDWSGEEYPGQIKKFLHARLKCFGRPDVKLNHSAVKSMLESGLIKRGEYVPLLLNCFDEQIRRSTNLKIAVINDGSDSYHITLIPQELFAAMENGVTDARVEDTAIWDLYITQFGESRTAAMSLLRKKLNISLAEIKAAMAKTPIFVGKGMKTPIVELKGEYEKAGCVMLMEKNLNQLDIKPTVKEEL